MSRVAQQAMAASYKALKEDFVSNLTGGEIGEINYVTAVALAASIFWSTLQARQSFFKQYNLLAFAVDFLLNVSAILVAMTLYASTPLLLNIILLAPVPILYFLPQHPPPKKTNLPPFATNNQSKNKALNPLPKKAFVTTYRGAMIVVTCIAILAVDFRVFPRRFAKVENWGTSLMDLGVGSFVFSAGIVAARRILKRHLTQQKPAPLGVRLSKSFRHSLPLILLGLIRLYTVKGLDYAEHVTEYGVHWNFFFTLAFLPPFVALCHGAFEYLPSYAGLAVALGVVYQAALEFTGLKAFVLTAPRTNLFNKNREGIFSFFGYLAIFLAGQELGLLVLPRGEGKTGGEQRKRLLFKMGAWSAGWILLFWMSTNYSYGLSLVVSRRLANLPYFLWTAAFNTTQLTAFCLVETIFMPTAHKTSASHKQDEEIYKASTSRVLEAFNRNGLAVFLVANLLTGLVNLTVPTLHVNNLQAMGILVAYAATVTGVAVGLDVYDITIKL